MVNFTLIVEALHRSSFLTQFQSEFIKLNLETHHQTIKAAIELFIREHYESLEVNTKLELLESFTGFQITMDLLKNLEDAELTLSKAELLISIYIEKIFLGDVFVNHDHDLTIEDIMHQLDDPNAALREENEIKECILENTELNISIYKNQDYELPKDLVDEFDNITLNPSHNNYLYDLEHLSTNFTNESLDNLSLKIIPNSKFDHLWEVLKYPNNLKKEILGHSKVSLSLKASNNLLINNSNKILLLHGPPGSGKTTLCKSIAQKLAIHNMQHDNEGGIFIEFQCSKIFSRFFGESCKNLETVFKDFRTVIESNPELLIIILIDEVETIASSRAKLLQQNETNDGIRVVNTLLTQLDQLKPNDNFLILATSNDLDSLDSAFKDRCDEIFHIGKPNSNAIYQILTQSINELILAKIIIHPEVLNDGDEFHSLLVKISEVCYRFDYSGRFLARLPMMVLAKSCNHNSIQISLPLFLKSLAKVIVK